MSGPERRVSFLIVGAQKAGTSALFEYLREVPALQLPAVKEAHFFDDESVNWTAPDYDTYHGLFESDDRLWGEATPIYCYWPNAAERICAYNPAMKLIMLLRDPVERAWSHWKMEYARGKEREPFAWCIREGRARMNQAAPHPGFDRVHSYVERGFYAAQIEHLLAHFPERQILPLQSSDLSANPSDSVARICDFLGATATAEPLRPRRARVAKEMDYPSVLKPTDVSYLQQLYRYDQRDLAELLKRWP